MALYAPSYLSKNRLGTYYFRCRIPETVRQQYHCDKVEVRKSLQTKDFKMALENARRLWIQMTDNDFYLSPSKNNPDKLSDLLNKYCAENNSRWGKTYEHKDVRPILAFFVKLPETSLVCPSAPKML